VNATQLNRFFKNVYTDDIVERMRDPTQTSGERKAWDDGFDAGIKCEKARRKRWLRERRERTAK